MEEQDEDDFNIIKPTLIQQLKKILDEYPDDGQILKEIIQNAEDANASHVKFVFDKHSYSTSTTLSNPEFKKFQGPALYAYNDAIFTPKDWKGIRMINNSIKAKDPMKVGRFGLGFKSVFHMTDLPGILSDEYIGMIDPQEKYFKDKTGVCGTGRKWKLDDSNAMKFPDPFQSYTSQDGIFGDAFSAKKYPGTLFRFPLRQEASLISDNLYSSEKVMMIFNYFQIEAKFTLLFLKRLESVELYVRNEGHQHPENMFQVRIVNTELVRSKRREFLNGICESTINMKPVTLTYPVIIETLKFINGCVSENENHSFLVTDYFAAGEISTQLQELTSDTSLSYLPWVGVALPIPSGCDSTVVDTNVNVTGQPVGHLFCFLPLPVEGKSLTGLPVHVNGFFALSQNRRHLKWPSADQDGSITLTDKALKWNKCLLEDVLPKAYAELVRQASVQLDGANKLYVYRAWPDVFQVDTRWRKMIECFFEQIFLENILYTKASGGKWIKINEAIIDRYPGTDEIPDIIHNVLLRAHMNIVTVPAHVLCAICKYFNGYRVTVEPYLLRDALRKIIDIYPDYNRFEKLQLLNFLLKDEDYVTLCDLQLLPLANGNFSKFAFYKNDENAVYVASDEHPQTLLPGLEQFFLDQSIEPEIVCQLKRVADSGCLQLRYLNEVAFGRMLHRVVPTQQSECANYRMWYPKKLDHCNPPNEWLEEVWKYLAKHFHDLKEFLHLPLIPVVTSGEAVILADIESPSTLVAGSFKGSSTLDDLVVNVLRVLGITVIDELPPFVSSHDSCFQYIHEPTLPGVLESLKAVSKRENQSIHRNLQSCSAEEKRALRRFLSHATTLDTNAKDILRNLPLFETLEGTGGLSSHFVAPTKVNDAAPEERLPVSPLVPLIDVSSSDSKLLAQLLDVKLFKITELLQSVVFPDVVDGKYSQVQIDNLMFHVLQHVPQYRAEDNSFSRSLKELPFLLCGTGSKRVKAPELFNPKSETLQNIFFDEAGRFPSQLYQDDEVIGVLLDLGLKKDNAITATDILESVKLVAKFEDVTKARIKSEAILHYLNKKPALLETCVTSGTTLLPDLLEIPWVIKAVKKPDYYPDSLSLYQTENCLFEKPRNLILNSKRLVSLVGTVRPTVQVQEASDLARFFGWDMDPPLEEVVMHLGNVVSSFVPEEKASFMSLVPEIYQYLSSVSTSVVQGTLKKLNIVKWIWNGNGFSSPSEIVIEKPFTDLSPYVHELPLEVNQFSEMFRNMDVKVKQDADLLVHVLHTIKNKYDNISREEKPIVKHDLQLAINILNELISNEDFCLTSLIHDQILLPIDVEDNETLLLAPVSDCTYCDTELLKLGAEIIDLDEDDDVALKYVHRDVPLNTVESLRVPTLISRVLDSDELGLGEDFGQSEPLTRRLNRLLEEYTDGFAVPKELIQNADDAGATEVKLMYDERTNEDARTHLIDDGMKDWQGPALWAYNDATFSDGDFENITKLSGATKENDSEKIGRFGLGFNAVYNLTDVPSFISRNNIVIFDPHTTHLGKAIKDKTKPGLKFDLTKPSFKKILRKFQDQFKPYTGVFSCDLNPKSDNLYYHGTLFRFPLRNRSRAILSEIKKIHYSDLEVKDLLKVFVRGSESLLLFTQNVLKVTVYHLPRECNDASQPIELFKVVKRPFRILQELDVPLKLSPSAIQLAEEEQSFVRQCSFLKALSTMLKENNDKNISSFETLQASMIVEMRSSVEDAGHHFFSDKRKLETLNVKHWLLFSCGGSKKLLQEALMDKSLRPSAGVAARLEVNGSKILPSPLVTDGDNTQGNVFCYLPLPISSGLPIHINGGFAVTPNRKHLKERTEDDKREIGADWNKSLLKDAVCKAYVGVLEDCKKVMLLKSGTVASFYRLWPTPIYIQPNLKPLLQSFYECVLASPDLPQLFTDGEKWVDIKQILFLDPEFRKVAKTGDAAFNVLKQWKGKEKVVVDLPDEILQTGQESLIAAKAFEEVKISKQIFFKTFFFPNIKNIAPHIRDSLTLYALNEDNQQLNEVMKKTACIPVSPNGDCLKCPGELIYPNNEARLLYEPEDNRFPHGESFLSKRSLVQLNQLGMVDTKDLSWEELLARTKTVQALMYRNPESAQKRIKQLILLISKKLEDVTDETEMSLENVRQKFLEVKFLPVMAKPRKFPLKWKGDELNSQELQLAAAKDLYPKKAMYRVCCTQLILNDSNVQGCDVLRFLKIQEEKVKLVDVWKQLEIAVEQANQDVNNSETITETTKICMDVYDHLQNEIKHCEDDVKRIQSEGLPFVFVKGHFVSTKQVALNFPHNCNPFLNQLPSEFSKFKELMVLAGVSKSFSKFDLVESLRKMKNFYRDSSLDAEGLRITVTLASELQKCISHEENKNDIKVLTPIYLPSSAGVLHPSGDLCVKDCIWMPDEKEVRYAHKDIPLEHAITLGVNTRRQETLRPYYKVLPFGQKEKLTNRLKRLLTTYPFQKEILKELLQNADDAQATKICFILDPRQHPDERVFEDNWKPLQGPALCVYNNKPFTNADLDGIQNLGEGSKGDDPNKTGQYGVGFNAVYHLTDVPTFLTKSDEIGEVLCAFDPHCNFVPMSTKEEPGMMIDVSFLRNTFTDVFPCYLENLGFSVDNATMFRFPLRSSEMASKSKISNEAVDITAIDKLMNELKQELFEVLLFVNSVQEISLCKVNEHNGELSNMYTVKTVMKEEDVEKRKRFSNYVMQIGRGIKNGEATFTDVEQKEISYSLELTDGKKSEMWFIIQRIGFENGTVIPDTITKAFRRGDLAILPRGGVASCIKSAFAKKKLKSFCFLPLPEVSGLPVHINGHFVLDHEGRRCLLKADTVGKEWNKLLLSRVLAPCYASLLSQVRNVLGLLMNGENKTKMRCKREEVCSLLKKYQDLFPPINLKDFYWSETAKEVYRCIERTQMRLLPVVRDFTVGKPGQKLESEQSAVEITWFSPTGEGNNQAFFCDPDLLPITSSEDLAKREELRDVLLRLNFNLIEAPLFLWRNFVELSINSQQLSPASLIKFFKTHASWNPLCIVGKLPAKIKDTPFEKVSNLESVLRYCMKYKAFTQELHGLPLLLTQDETIQVFDLSKPKFLTPYFRILPESWHEFVHESLFNMFSSVKEEIIPVFKKFRIQDFARLLPQQHFPELCTGTTKVLWNAKSPRKMWLQRVWWFLEHELNEILKRDQNDENIRHYITGELTSLNDWCLLPATETGNLSLLQTEKPDHYLVPFGKSKTVIDLVAHSSPWTAQALRKFDLPQLDYKAIQGELYVHDRVRIARCLVATLDNPSAVLVSLLERLTRDISIKADLREEFLTILVYFSKRLKCLDSTMLRRLPFYETVQGDHVQIDGLEAFVLPQTVPGCDLHMWKEKTGTVFLKSFNNLKELYNYIGCSVLTETEVYIQFIFQHFEDMSPEGRMKHLDHLREQLLKSNFDNCDRQILLAKLKTLRFIPSGTGEFFEACCYYNPRNTVFTTMLSESGGCFPPQPFNESKWLDFLCQIGLICEVTLDKFIDFAKQVELGALTNGSEQTKNKSKVLLSHLFQRDDLISNSVLQQICDIHFIYPADITPDLEALCPSHNRSSYISFKGSLLKTYQNITWSCVSILPQKANPRENLRHDKRVYAKNVIRELGVLETPNPDDVVEHCVTLCDLHAEQGSLKKFPSLKSVMKEIYEFLKDVSQRSQLERLKKTKCVMVEEENRFVLPEQIVVDFRKEDEIAPYLYKLPSDIGSYEKLFKELGSANTVTADQYAMVLHMIRTEVQGNEESKEKKLHPNELAKSYKAVKGLFEKLHNDCSLNVPTLFLPARRPDQANETPPVFLMKSSSIVFDDAPHFRGRIKVLDEFILVDLRECELKGNFEEMVLKLPKKLQPQMLTAVVNEALIEKAKKSVVTTGQPLALQNLLISSQFVQGVVRLIRHEDRRSRIKTNENFIEKVKQTLQFIQVHEVRNLVTCLNYKGTSLPETEKETTCFAEKVRDSGREFWTVYIQSFVESKQKKRLLSKVAEVVSAITNGLLRESSIHLPLMLECDINEIQLELDKLGIREDHSIDISQSSTLPQPGTFIHIEDHHLLVNKFEDFEPGEYVGYELEDPSLEQEEGTPTYIYAIIIEEVFDGGKGSSYLTKKYKINVGNGLTAVAEAIDLYKFYRVKEAPTTALEVYHGEIKHECPKPKVSKTLEQAMNEVSELLEEAWKLPKEKTMKIIRRLYLTWHPDKNLGNEYFCSEVFKHILTEIARLERGDPKSKQGSSTSSSEMSNEYSGKFSSFFSSWSTRASSHHEQWARTTFRSSYRPNPQPSEAKRWFRQAEVDLIAAANDVVGIGQSYEWACFKCHQAAEKALKAAQYSKDANKSNLHNLLSNASCLDDTELSTLASKLEDLLIGSASMRYPDTMCFPKIPHDVYTEEMAIEARQLTQKILNRVRSNFIQS